jgi:hypothetical protein
MAKQLTYTTNVKLTVRDADMLDRFSNATGISKAHILRTGMQNFIMNYKKSDLSIMLDYHGVTNVV